MKVRKSTLISLSIGRQQWNVAIDICFDLTAQNDVVNLFTLMSGLFVMKQILPALSELKYGSANA